LPTWSRSGPFLANPDLLAGLPGCSPERGRYRNVLYREEKGYTDYPRWTAEGSRTVRPVDRTGIIGPGKRERQTQARCSPNRSRPIPSPSSFLHRRVHPSRYCTQLVSLRSAGAGAKTLIHDGKNAGDEKKFVLLSDFCHVPEIRAVIWNTVSRNYPVVIVPA